MALRPPTLDGAPMLAIGAGGLGEHGAASRHPTLAIGAGGRVESMVPPPGTPTLAIGAGGRVGRMVPPPGARGQPWRYTQRGRAQGRHLILGGTGELARVLYLCPYGIV